jgi:hypothetical protein
LPREGHRHDDPHGGPQLPPDAGIGSASRSHE